MITREQAINCNVFHDDSSGSCRKWRRNGKTQTWKRDESRFRVPVKFGLYSYGQLTELVNDEHIHVEEECPRREG